MSFFLFYKGRINCRSDEKRIANILLLATTFSLGREEKKNKRKAHDLVRNKIVKTSRFIFKNYIIFLVAIARHRWE